MPQIYSLIHHLSKIMRYSMNMDEDVVPLADELNYIEAFLLLQKNDLAISWIIRLMLKRKCCRSLFRK
ncbi:histidine kinase [Bacillus sp. N9]